MERRGRPLVGDEKASSAGSDLAAFRSRYLRTMLLVLAMDVGLHIFFGLTTQRWVIVLSNVPLQALVFLGLNLWGASILYRPIAAFIDGSGNVDQAARRIQELPTRSSMFTFAIVCPTMAINVIAIPLIFSPMTSRSS